MLAEYLDHASLEIGDIRKKAREVKRRYDETLDKDLRLDLVGLDHKLKAKTRQLWETIYENMEEFRYMRKHFPELFRVYAEDENVGKYVIAKEWLAEFEPVSKEKAEKMLIELKETLGSMDKAKKATNHWPHWKEHISEDEAAMLSGLGINEKTDREEYLTLLNESRKDIVRRGWVILLNEPFIIKYVNRFLERLKQSVVDEARAKLIVHESNGQGTLMENTARNDYRNAVKEKKLAEMLCRHLLMANPIFLRRFKAQHLVWRDKLIASFMDEFLKGISPPILNEKEWVTEMKKKINE